MAVADVVLGASTPDASLVVLIVAARLFVPLLIPRVPLVILVALVIDAADQTLLATFTAVDTSETGSYQSVDIGLFFAFLITTIIWLYNAYRPLYRQRGIPSAVRCA